MTDKLINTDTGTAGFDVDGKVYTFDTGLPDAEGGSQGSVDHGGVKVDDSPKDLTAPTKVTLAQYMSNLTRGGEGAARGTANKYPVDPGSTSFDVSGDKGNPTPAPASPDNSAAFAAQPPDAYSALASSLRSALKKGKSSNSRATDGNDLLPGVTGDSVFTASPGSLAGDPLAGKPPKGHPDTSTIVKPYVSAVLASNRFTGPSNASAAAIDQPGSYDPAFTSQQKLGSFDPNAPTVTVGRLAQIGPILTLRAGIELGSNDPGFSANSTAGAAGALLPGVAQLAVSRVSQTLLNAKDVLAGLTTDEVPAADVISPGSLSWGSLNNTEDQFSGIAALGMSALSAALVAGLLLVIDGLSVVLSLITSQPKQVTHDSLGRYALGAYYGGLKKKSDGGLLGAATALLSLDIGSLLGINPTNFPFSAALTKGSSAFFGIDTSGGIIGQVVGAAASSLGPDAGFNSVVARAIIRSALTISDQISKIGGNPISAVKQVIGLIDVLKSSKIIAACNVFAQLGDAILSLPDEWTDSDAQGAGDKVSAIDAQAVPSAVGQSRLAGTLKLAWASNRSPANLLISQQVGAASRIAKSLGSYDSHAMVLHDDSAMQAALIKQDSVPRISPADAEKFEQQLDAEYVPFYFHDVRTNEMVGFHAFLASLTDDYTANYESVDAYGRVEPVKIYKSTGRRISMSFYVAATSHSDFDDMWIKLNKLVTMVYPQYTAGKQIQDSTGNYVFTQPFSQLIGASPLVRIRLGDLLRSNYSRFNLARLFGLGNTNFTLNGTQFANFDKFDQDAIINQLPTKIEAAKTAPGNTFLAAPGSYPRASTKGGGIGISIGPPPGPNTAPSFSPTGNPDFFELKVVKENPDDSRSVICEVQVTTDAESLQSLSGLIAAINKDFNDDSKPLQKYVGGQYVFPKASMVATRATHDKVVDQIVSIAENDSFVQPLRDFMDPDKNVVAKSFNDTAGKGLAGFIETMNFDWYDHVTWETGLKDRTAPKMVRVSIGFSPVHDVSPGLDHFGVDRAPVYPVGLLAPRFVPKQ